MHSDYAKPAGLKIALRDRYIKRLLGYGMNGMVLGVRPFSLRLTSFTSVIEGLKPKMIESETQYKFVSKLLANPRLPGTFCISSQPNDRIAKALAAFFMQNYLATQTNTVPMWHDIMGGFSNPLVGPNASRPGMLVLANVVPNSTNTKFEKLRDILETHPNIPKIVVTSGDDPFSFFTKHLHYPMNGCAYLCSSIMRPDVEI